MSTPVTELPGIGPKTAEQLAEQGIDTIQALLDAGVERLAQIPGISQAKAEAFIQSASELAGTEQTAAVSEPVVEPAAAVESPAPALSEESEAELLAQKTKRKKKDRKKDKEKRKKKNKDRKKEKKKKNKNKKRKK